MAGGATHLGERRDAVAGCAAALRDLHTVLHQCASGELAGLAADLAELRALCGAQLGAVVAQAETRGVVDASQCASTSAWVADVAWHSRREATTIAKTAKVLRRPDLAAVADALLGVDIDPAAAVVVVGAEYDTLSPDLRDDATATPPGQTRQLRLADIADDILLTGALRLSDSPATRQRQP